MSLTLFGQTIVNGILIGLLFGLAGIGLTLIFGIMRILNIAQGTLMVLGAYIAFFSFVNYSIDPLISVFLSGGVGLVFGLILYRSSIRRLVHRGHALASLLFLFGLSMVMETSMMELWSPFPRSIPVDYPGINLGSVIIGGNRNVVSILAIIVALLFFAFLKWTYFGRAIRATVQDRTAAFLMGINVERIYAFGFAIGIAITTLSGGLVGFIFIFDPFGGLRFTLYAFVVVVLGTIGNPVGCLVAGLIIGLVHSFTGSYWLPAMSPAIAYMVLVITFILKPEGIMAKKG